MKKTVFSMAMIVALAGGMIAISSCEKAKLNKETTSEEDNTLAENTFDDVFKITDEATEATEETTGKMEKGRFGRLFGSCDTVYATLNTTTHSRTITIDFGSGCICKDGRTRSGIIKATITGRWMRDNSVTTTITFDNYYVNSNKVEGTKTVSKTRNNSGKIQFVINVDGKVITSDGDEITWKSDRVRVWEEGEETRFMTHIDSTDATQGIYGFAAIEDDVYKITGSASGTNRNGRAYTATITTALNVAVCNWHPEITKGVIEMQPEDLKKRVVDYGNGDCDNEATVTVGNKTYTIKANRMKR